MSEFEAVQRRADPNTRSSIARELRALGLGAGPEPAPLIVHASLSRLGWVCGGPVAVCQALFDVVGRGDVVMPAQTTENSDPSFWTAPPVPESWWPIIRAEMPAFDPRLAPTRQMGAIAETFRAWPGTERSAHPCVSFCARGPRAGEILRPHALEASFGDASPLGRLYEMDARILLLGTEYDACTALHLAEARFEATPSRVHGAPVLAEDGRREWCEYKDFVYDADRFLWIGHDYERSARKRVDDRSERKRDPPGADICVGAVGSATCRLISMRPLVDFALAWLRRKGSK